VYKVPGYLVLLLLSLSVAGCDRSDEVDGDSAGSVGTTGGSNGDKPTCEIVSKIELADENEVAPNGQTGAQILAAVPESLHTSLHWDFSTSGIEVEVPGSIGLSTELDLSFSFPSEPRFFFEDRTVVDPSGPVDLDVEVICEDYVTTTLDVTVVTEDETILLDLTGLTVRLGPDRPETDYVAKPSVYETLAMVGPEVNFLKPEALTASTDKTISMVFDGLSIEGALIVYAEGPTATHEHLVARW
jgi:hypothetical protein